MRERALICSNASTGAGEEEGLCARGPEWRVDERGAGSKNDPAHRTVESRACGAGRDIWARPMAAGREGRTA
jgi:hypothetical protein